MIPLRDPGSDAAEFVSMATYICMLRGVNVGGHNQIRMEVLRTLCGSIGLSGAQTYLQSGNVVFRCDEKDPARLAPRIEEAIRASAGIDVKVILRTPAELKKVIAANPFTTVAERDPKRLLVTFLSDELSAEAKAALLKANDGSEEIHIAKREIYIHFPDGMGRSKLMTALTDKKLKVTTTGRNWNTVMALAALAEAI